MVCRIPKADEGHRLIALVRTFHRIGGRARREISRSWEERNRCENVWGNRTRYTSSDSAFSHNLESEIAVLRGHFSATILLDLTKAFDL
eukprot:8993223-Pyramimonas_sp.AAC.1